ncbi:hypothetical protein LTR85_006404 [Meristemomyces frigidus]|nr:hypothetical protein LTR85_006404 [Meristemomyces frigidus]
MSLEWKLSGRKEDEEEGANFEVTYGFVGAIVGFDNGKRKCWSKSGRLGVSFVVMRDQSMLIEGEEPVALKRLKLYRMPPRSSTGPQSRQRHVRSRGYLLQVAM